MLFGSIAVGILFTVKVLAGKNGGPLLIYCPIKELASTR